ncbi:MAG TPA: hypothetical protein ENJ54_00265 [Chloroflexi bacterium]|nr:hypothetical protein [Chloroflexota bacterium]
MRKRRGQALVETAIALPIVVFVAVFVINGAMAAVAASNAGNAANYGARVGAVTQRGAAGAAVAAARQALATAPIGHYEVSASGGGPPGSQVVVVVQWRVPNLLGALLGLVGGGDVDFHGRAMATFRQEGW